MRTEKNKLKMKPNPIRLINFKIKQTLSKAKRELDTFEPFAGKQGKTFLAVKKMREEKAKFCIN